jgi:RNA polymerase sigma-70 factor (ECF subfamily)
MSVSAKINEPSETDRIAEMESYTAFFRKHYPALLFYASRFLDADQAEDVVQDAFADLWFRRNSIKKSDHLRAFMYRSVYTRALNKLKHSSVVNSYSAAYMEIQRKKAEYMSPDDSQVLKKIEDDELGAQITEAIGSLPDKCRKVFTLSYLHSLNNGEIANALGITVRTVEAHMYKALKLLRSRLGHLTMLMLIILFDALRYVN